jgi:hypothetical protein
MLKQVSIIAAKVSAIVALSLAPTDAGAWLWLDDYWSTSHVTHTPISAISTVPGGSSLFMVGTTGVIWTCYFDPRGGAAWTPASDLSGKELAATHYITALSTLPGGSSLFTAGSDGNIWSNYFDPRTSAKWQDTWFSLGGGNIFGNPKGASGTRITAISTMPGGTSLYGVGKDGAVWTKFFDPRGDAYWSEWFPLGSTVSKGTHVTALSTMENGTSLYMHGLDHAVWTRWFDPRDPKQEWSPWVSLGGNMKPGTEVTAISTVPGGTTLFIVGPDGDVLTQYFDPVGSKWSGWYSLGGVARNNSSITAISTLRSRTQVFVVGLDDAVWMIEFDPRTANPQWSPWTSLGGKVNWETPDISAISTVPGGTTLFIRDDQERIATNYVATGVGDGWSGWYNIC